MQRVPDYEIDPQFLERWSPRAMSGQPVSESDLMRLFEAARWAPSSGNFQPWRFIYAFAATSDFDKFFDFLGEGNRNWCGRAGVLIVVVSKMAHDDGTPVRTHSFDTGAAWMIIALQGLKMGLTVHAMAGFHRERARIELGVPDGFNVECMIAVGHPGKVEDLVERDKVRETPSGRRPVRELVMEGKWA